MTLIPWIVSAGLALALIVMIGYSIYLIFREEDQE